MSEQTNTEWNFPSLDVQDVIHLQQLENLHGRDRVVGWLRGKVAVPLRHQFDEEFDEDEYYNRMAEHYINPDETDLAGADVDESVDQTEDEAAPELVVEFTQRFTVRPPDGLTNPTHAEDWFWNLFSEIGQDILDPQKKDHYDVVGFREMNQDKQFGDQDE